MILLMGAATARVCRELPLATEVLPARPSVRQAMSDFGQLQLNHVCKPAHLATMSDPGLLCVAHHATMSCCGVSPAGQEASQAFEDAAEFGAAVMQWGINREALRRFELTRRPRWTHAMQVRRH